MSRELAWPFLIGRAKDDDYRFVVIPEVMTDSPLAAALRAGTDGDPDGPETVLVREISVTPGPPVTAVYRVRRAHAEDYGIAGDGPLADAYGRPVLLTEGVVIRRPASSVLASGVTQAALNRAHEHVAPAFRQFWGQGSGFVRQVGQPFAVPAAGPPGPGLRLAAAETAADLAPGAPDGTEPRAAAGPPAPPTAPARHRRPLAGAAFACAAAVIVVLAVAGTVLLAGRLLRHPGPPVTVPAAALAMANLCRDLRSGHPEQAYSRTAAAYRTRVPEAAFASAVLPGGAPAGCAYRLQVLSGRTAQAAMTVTQHSVPASWLVTLSAEPDGEWQVAALTRG